MIFQKLKREAATIRDIIYHRLYYKGGTERDLIDQFHKLYYDSSSFNKTWKNTWWMGVPVGKCPFDLWIYQELIYEIKPDLIIETGTCFGGSAYYYASICDLLSHGKVVTIDIDDAEMTLYREQTTPLRVRPEHPRIKYLRGSSTSESIVRQVKEMAQSTKRVLVTLDSDHRAAHVIDELKTYGPLVSKGSYLVVEDSNINSHPVYPSFGPGPMEAIDLFMKNNTDYVIDTRNENHLVTFNPKGLLRKIR